MKKNRISYWENTSFLRDVHFTIIGAGITGISTAIELKQKYPKSEVVVLDRHPFGLGASTRNAGFACFGSVSELVDDLSKDDEDNVLELLEMRWEGLKILKERVGVKNFKFEATGSFELLEPEDPLFLQYIDVYQYLNSKIEKRLGIKDTFQLKESPQFNFKGFHKSYFFNQYEAVIHPGMMMQKLHQIAGELDCRLLLGAEVSGFTESKENVLVHTPHFDLRTDQLIICTNGFSNDLLKGHDVSPARNQVLLTSEIPGLKWKGAFHFDKGYTYFRNVEKRILIGGARNINYISESTSEFDITEEIFDHLKNFLEERILHNTSFTIDKTWSGILGVGKIKTPIVKKLNDRVSIAIRMGGMGVALASFIAKEVISLLDQA